METAILAVTVLILAGLCANGFYLYRLCDKVQVLVEAYARTVQAMHEVSDSQVEVHDLLLEASKRNALRNPPSVFDPKDGAKIPVSGSLKYVPVARRRAQAERATMEPANHQDKVRANNARAMETL